MAHPLPIDKREEFLVAFEAFLQTKGLRNTSERKEILEILFESDEHLEAEDILIAIRKDGKRVSRATIYRTISLLVEAGLLKTVSLEHRHNHYELVLKNMDHDHIACLQCDNVIERNTGLAETLVHAVCERYRYVPVRRNFEIVVACPRCDTSPEAAQQIELANYIRYRKLPSNKDEFVETFREYLRLRHLRFTTERRAIIDILFEAHPEDHLDAETILYKLQQRDEQVSRATIYRSLALFVESGLVKTVSFEQRHACYEVMLRGGDHDHLICAECNSVVEFHEDLSDDLMREMSQDMGFIPVRRHFEIIGICPECQPKVERAE